jgi:ABC-type transporter Mla subunit MlaD
VVVILTLALSGGRGPGYRVDVVFDTAKGIVPGQLVKVAGARVGTVDDVNLTPDRKARLSLSITSGPQPFRADATCQILPEGFISENFVECDPGSAGAELAPRPNGVPTVPVEHTTVPIALQDVIDVFALPVDQRIRLILNELGLATAARGADLNEILRRANPTLSKSRRVLAILAGQHRELTNAIGQTDEVLTRLAGRRADLRSFIARSAAVTDETARHSEPLGRAVAELPPLLDATETGLAALRRISHRGTPMLRDLRDAAPALQDVTKSLTAFARPGRPALQRLGDAAAVGKPAIEDARPAIASLRDLGSDTKPVPRQIAQLSDSLARTGGIENVLKLTYQLAAQSAAYDSTSHMAAIYIGLYPQCLLDLKQRGCSHAYSAPGNGTIPANAPSAGPQKPGAVLPAKTKTTSPTETRRAVNHDQKNAAPLLDFLLR